MLINYGKLIPWESQYCMKIKIKRIMAIIQEDAAAINYQDIISKQPIYHSSNNIFMKCLYSNTLSKLGSFYDQHIEVTLSKSIQGFTTKDIYIP